MEQISQRISQYRLKLPMPKGGKHYIIQDFKFQFMLVERDILFSYVFMYTL